MNTNFRAESLQVNQLNPQNQVLLIEGDDEIASIIEFMLERANYKLHRALTGKQAHDWILSHQPTILVLIDLALPYQDGPQIIRLIRTTPLWSQIPILVLTEAAQPTEIERSLNQGASDYITKPFQPSELLERIKKLTRAS